MGSSTGLDKTPVLPPCTSLFNCVIIFTIRKYANKNAGILLYEMPAFLLMVEGLFSPFHHVT